MFAVEGWKLGKVVAQTAPKKKLKRKRDEKEETTAKAEKTEKYVRVNPFSLGNGPQSTKGKSKKKSKKSDKTAPTEPKKDAEEGGKAVDVPAKPAISMRQAARDRAAKKLARLQQAAANAENIPESNAPLQVLKTETSPKPSVQTTLTPLQQKMRAKLAGSQFRHINEKLYTTHSSEALNLFTEQPSLFHDVSSSITVLRIVSSRIPTSSSIMANKPN
jgi:ribosomal RNA-processing protein 8